MMYSASQGAQSPVTAVEGSFAIRDCVLWNVLIDLNVNMRRFHASTMIYMYDVGLYRMLHYFMLYYMWLNCNDDFLQLPLVFLKIKEHAVQVTRKSNF